MYGSISHNHTLVQVDVDKSGSIDYTEFLTAMMNKHKVEKGGGFASCISVLREI